MALPACERLIGSIVQAGPGCRDSTPGLLVVRETHSCICSGREYQESIERFLPLWKCR